MRNIAALLLVLLFAPTVCFAGSYSVVSNNSQASELSKDDLRKIFLGEKSFWPDGERIVVVMLKGKKQHKTDFLKEVVKVSDRKFDQHWKAKLFSGLGYPPQTFKSSTALVNFMENNTNTIGLVPAKTDSELQVIFSGEGPSAKSKQPMKQALISDL